jgi:hypothetical protein
MTVKVDLAALDQQAAVFGTNPFLLTVSPDRRPHAVSVRVEWDGTTFQLRAGRTSLANMAANPDVTLLWAPPPGHGSDGGYSLIVDGLAKVVEDRVTVAPASSLLHRTVAHTAEDPAGSDCLAVLPPGAA